VLSCASTAFVAGCASRAPSDDGRAAARPELWQPAPPATLSEGELALLNGDQHHAVEGAIDPFASRNDDRLGVGGVRTAAPALATEVVVRDVVRRDRIVFGRSWNDDRVTTRIRERVDR
jgi:hypothetical protein